MRFDDPMRRDNDAGDAGVAELADAMDSKSIARKGVGVRVPPPALARTRSWPAAARAGAGAESPLVQPTTEP